MGKILKKNIWSHGTPLGYLGVLSWDQIVDFFQNSMGMVIQGLRVTPIPVLALENFRPLRGHTRFRCGMSYEWIFINPPIGPGDQGSMVPGGPRMPGGMVPRPAGPAGVGGPRPGMMTPQQMMAQQQQQRPQGQRPPPPGAMPLNHPRPGMMWKAYCRPQ